MAMSFGSLTFAEIAPAGRFEFKASHGTADKKLPLVPELFAG